MNDNAYGDIWLPWVGICPVKYNPDLIDVEPDKNREFQRLGSYITFLTPKGRLFPICGLVKEEGILNILPVNLSVQDWSVSMQNRGLLNFYQTREQLKRALEEKESNLKRYPPEELVRHTDFGVLDCKVREVIKRHGVLNPKKRISVDLIALVNDLDEVGSPVLTTI